MEAADSGLDHVRLLTTAQSDGGGEERLYGHAQMPEYYFKRHQFYLQSRADVLKTRIKKQGDTGSDMASNDASSAGRWTANTRNSLGFRASTH
jgi:hypothetical protein